LVSDLIMLSMRRSLVFDCILDRIAPRAY